MLFNLVQLAVISTQGTAANAADAPGESEWASRSTGGSFKVHSALPLIDAVYQEDETCVVRTGCLQ